MRYIKRLNKIRLVTSCIKHWGLSGYLKFSAPHWLLQRQTGTKPAIPNVSYMYPLAPIIEASQISFYDRFSGLESFVFHAGGLFFAEDFSSFDKLVFKRKKQKARQTFSRGLTAGFFSSAEKKTRRTILEWSFSPILTVLILGEKKQLLGRQFFAA